ncbi:MAG TPA: YncE family protein, partial [Terriglobales bacterium]|nr:YncE family protein [Terriglobales bacterium]
DTASFSLKATLTFGKTPDVFLSGIAISPDGSRVYVTEGTGGNVWVVDTATNSIAATIALANSGLGNASVSPDGKTLYVVAWTKGTIGNSYYLEVIDTHTNTATGHIDLGDFGLPTEIAQTPDGAHLYFTGLVGDLMVIDTANNAVADRVTISKGNPLLGVAITPDGTRAYVSCGNNDTIYVVDTATNRVLESIRSDYPGGLAIAQAR